MSARVYGAWSADPLGRAENPEHCIAEVYESFSRRFFQCQRKRTNGELCKQHSPEFLKARDTERAAKYRAKRAVANQDFNDRIVGARLSLANPELYSKLLNGESK